MRLVATDARRKVKPGFNSTDLFLRSAQAMRSLLRGNDDGSKQMEWVRRPHLLRHIHRGIGRYACRACRSGYSTADRTDKCFGSCNLELAGQSELDGVN